MMILITLLSHSAWIPLQEGVQPPPAVLAACSAVANILSDVPVTALERSNAAVENERTHRRGDGCSVRLLSSVDEFTDSETPDQRVRVALPIAGWVEDWDFGADGPDGTAFGLRKGSVLCQFRASWDGGDITDPTYVPDPRYELVGSCMEDRK